MEAALRAGGFVIATTRFVFRRWTRLVRGEVVSLYRRVSLEIEGVPAHAWSWRVARKILAPSCWIESMEAASESRTDMSKISLTAWCHEPSCIPLAKTLLIAEHGEALVMDGHQAGSLAQPLRRKKVLMYNVIIHLRRIEDFEPLPPPPPAGESSAGAVDDGGANEAGRDLQGLPRVRTFVCYPGVIDGQPPRSLGGGAQVAALESAPHPLAVSGAPGDVGPRVLLASGQHCPGPLHTESPAPSLGQQSNGQAAACDAVTTTMCIADAGCRVSDTVPFELQCSRTVTADHHWTDPMQFEIAIPAGGVSQRKQTPVAAGKEPVHAITQPVRPPPLLTYQRRPKMWRTADPPVTPTRLDFDQDGPEAPMGCWALPNSRRRTPQRPRDKSGRPPTPSHHLPSPPVVLQQNASSTPPADSTVPATPSTEAAIAATSAFLAGITLATRSPLIKDVPTKAQALLPPPPGPRRSSRLSAQPLNMTVRPSKKGEVLAMMRLGFISRMGAADDNVRREYDRFFNSIVDIKNLPALRDLFPAARDLSDEELLAAAAQARAMVEGF